MTKIGYRFINWALIFLAGFIIYEFTRNVDGMEGTIVSERYKGAIWHKDLQMIDLDDSFIYVLIEKNDNFKIGDRVRMKCSNKLIINRSYPLQAIIFIVIMIVCFVVLLFRILTVLNDDWEYRRLKD